MNIAWNSVSKTVQKQFVEYGRFAGELKRIAPSQVEESQVEKRSDASITWIYNARLGGLIPNSKVYYRIVKVLEDGRLQSTETRYFISKPEYNNVDQVRFVAYGDMGQQTDNAFKVAEQITKLVSPNTNSPLHFALHVGDLAYPWGNFTRWNVWSSMMSEITSTTPYMVTAGNRDAPISILEERMTMPSPYQPMKGHKNLYFEFDYGHLAVVTVSWWDLEGDNYTLDSPQMLWLDQTLERYHSRVEDPEDPLNWIVFATHSPMYSSSDGHKGGNEKLRGIMEHFLFKYQVSIGIFGDDHNYERSYPVFDHEIDKEYRNVKEGSKLNNVFHNPKKPIHLLVGTAGIGLDGWISQTPPQWSAYREISHGFVKFDVSSTQLRGQFIRFDGTIGDQFWIIKGEETNPRKDSSFAPSQALFFYILVILLGVGIFCVRRKPQLLNFYTKGR